MKDLKRTFKKSIESNRFLLISFLLALVSRITWLLVFDPDLVSDANWYFAKAINITNGLGYVTRGHPTAFYPVGYPAFLSGLFFIFGNHILVGRLTNVILHLLSLFVFYRLSMSLSRSKFSVHLSVFLLALYPNHIAYVNLLFNENLFLLLFLLLIVVLLKLSKQQKKLPWKMILLSSICLAAATYIKPQAFLIPFIVLPVFYFFQKKKLSVLTRHLILILIFSLMFIFPWQIRNYRAFQKITFITTVKGYDLLIGNNPYASGNYYLEESYWKNISIDSNEAIYDQRTKTMAINYIKTHPLKTIRLIPEKVFYFFWPGMEGISWNMTGIKKNKKEFLHHFRYWFNGAFVLFVVLFFVSLFYLLFQKSEKQLCYLILFLFIYYLVLSVIFFGESRFHFHLIPFMFLCVSIFLEKMFYTGK